MSLTAYNYASARQGVKGAKFCAGAMLQRKLSFILMYCTYHYRVMSHLVQNRSSGQLV